jgi:hypothetical protein
MNLISEKNIYLENKETKGFLADIFTATPKKTAAGDLYTWI